jgi:hypothetical protein
MTSWEHGTETIHDLIARGELDRVAASEDLAKRLLREARANLASARTVRARNPGGAMQLAYDAARKAATALLGVQGLRPTSAGGHVAVRRAVIAQFGDPFSRFGRMRRRRHEQEYPDADSPTATNMTTLPR